MKKLNSDLTIVLVILFMICSLSGCTPLDSLKDHSQNNSLQRLAKIEVFLDSDDKPVNTVTDQETLLEYVKLGYTFEISGSDDETEISGDTDDSDEEALSLLIDQAKLHDAVKDSSPFCKLVTYKRPAAIINNGRLEKASEITVYAEEHIVKEQVSPETVKSMPISPEYLEFYYSISDEALNYYLSLTNPG